MSRLTDIADAVVAELAGGTFVPAFTPRYRDLVDFRPEQLAAVEVSIVPSGARKTRITRTSFQHDCYVDYAVQKRVNPHDKTECLALHNLGEAIDEFLTDRPLAAAAFARYLGSELKTAAHPQHLDELHVFTAVYTLTYRIMP